MAVAALALETSPSRLSPRTRSVHRSAEHDAAHRSGEFVSVVGPTGCGKSTLLNVAVGCSSLPPAASGVRRAVAGLNRKAGYLFQTEALMPWRRRCRT